MTIKEYILNNSTISNNENQIIAVLKHKQKDEYAYIENIYKVYGPDGVNTYCIVIFDPSKDGFPISMFDHFNINDLEDELYDYSIDTDNYWLFKSEKKLKNHLESIERKAFNLI